VVGAGPGELALHRHRRPGRFRPIEEVTRMPPIHDPFDLPSLTPDGLAAVVAANVRFEAARHGLRQQDVAAIVRISRSAVSLRFTGKAPWTLDEVGRLAEALGIRPGELTVPPPRPARPAW
jgi:hypothetical protein